MERASVAHSIDTSSVESPSGRKKKKLAGSPKKLTDIASLKKVLNRNKSIYSRTADSNNGNSILNSSSYEKFKSL